jgi:hypothetical protein
VIWILGAWIYLIALFSILGAATTVALLRAGRDDTWRPGTFLQPWSGMCVVSAIAMSWSLVAPVGVACHGFLVLAALSSLGFASVRREWGRGIESLRGVPGAAWVVIGWVALMIAFAGTDGPVYNLDSGRYHFQNLLWAKQYGTVPGIANIHSRYGFSSALYLLHAAIDWGPLTSRSYHVLNGLILFLLVAFGVVCGFRFDRRTDPVAASMLLVLVFFGIYYDEFRYLFLSTLTPDLAVNVFIVLCLLVALDAWSGPGGPSRTGFLLLALFASQTFAMRPSGAFVGAIVIAVALPLIRKGAYRLVVLGLAAGLALALPSLVRSYILSGWPLFPSTTLGVLSPDWQYPHEETLRLMKEGIQRFAYMAPFAEGPAFTRFHHPIDLRLAFVLWLRHQIESGGFLYWLFGGLIASLVVSRKARDTEARGVALVAVMGQLAAAAWVLTSPHFRYGFGYLVVAFGAPVGLLLAQGMQVNRWTRAGRVGAVLVALGLAANITLKTTGVSLRESGALYPVRIGQALVGQWILPLQDVPRAPFVVRDHQGLPFHQVLWDGSYVKAGRFPRPPIKTLPGPTTDENGVMFTTFDAGYNAGVAIMMWETPIPAWAGIFPGLERRGPSLADGFRRRPQGD